MRKISALLILLVVTLACALPGAPAAPQNTPPQPASNIDSLQTVIVETANAAQTQTQSILPTLTFTPTATFTPSITPTYTPTFIYLLHTSTPIPTYTIAAAVEPGSIAVGSGTPGDYIKWTGEEWTCSWIGTAPAKNTEFKPKTPFIVYWTLLNTGTKAWPLNGVDFVYTGGFRHEETKIQDFTRTVSPGGKVTVSASFIAPKVAGVYQSFFKLMVGKRMFCPVKYIFEVVEK